MRPWVPLVLAFTAFVAAQGSGNNVINNPSSGIQATAGESLTITWENPSSGTVTIKIQTSGSITPEDGIIVVENIPNTGSATFPIPTDVPVGEVFIQIINDSNPSDFNFSGGFQVQGATNTASLAPSTASSASASASASSSSASSASASSASESMSSMSSSASTSSASASSSSSASASSRSASASASRSSAASASAQSTTAPTGAAVPLKAQVQGGLFAAVLGVAALL